MAKENNRNLAIPSGKKLTIGLLLMSNIISQSNAAIQGSQAQSQAQLTAELMKEDLQIQVYDAVEQMHEDDEWAGDQLPTDQLIQMQTSEHLNHRIMSHINSENNNNQEQSIKGRNLLHLKSKIMTLDCIVGGEKCLYLDQKNLIEGKVTNLAQHAFEEGKTVMLPGQSDLLGTEEDIMIDQGAFDKEGKLNVEALLGQKSQSEMKTTKNGGKIDTKSLIDSIIKKAKAVQQPKKEATINKKAGTSVKKQASPTKPQSVSQKKSAPAKNIHVDVKKSKSTPPPKKEVQKKAAKKVASDKPPTEKKALQTEVDIGKKVKESKIKPKMDKIQNDLQDMENKIRAEAEQQLNTEEMAQAEAQANSVPAGSHPSLLSQSGEFSEEQIRAEAEAELKDDEDDQVTKKQAVKLAILKTTEKKQETSQKTQSMVQKKSSLSSRDQIIAKAIENAKKNVNAQKNLKPNPVFKASDFEIKESETVVEKATPVPKPYIQSKLQENVDDLPQVEPIAVSFKNLETEAKKNVLEKEAQKIVLAQEEEKKKIEAAEAERKRLNEKEAMERHSRIQKQKKLLAEKLQKDALANHKMMQRLKQDAALKLQKAAEQQRLQQQTDEARQQAQALAKIKAHQMAEMKAAMIAQSMLAQQEELELQQIQQEKIESENQNKLKVQQDRMKHQTEEAKRRAEQIAILEQQEAEVKKQRDINQKVQEEQQRKLEEVEKEKAKKEKDAEDEKTAGEMNLSDMISAFKSQNKAKDGEENNNIQLSSELARTTHENDDLLAQTGGKDFDCPIQTEKLNFKIIPGRFGDQLSDIKVLSHEKMLCNKPDLDKYSVTINFQVTRSRKLKESTLAQLSNLDINLLDLNKDQGKKEDSIDEQFSQIQIQDMAQEKYTDQKVKEVIKTQQQALSEKSLIDESSEKSNFQLIQNDSINEQSLSEAEKEANLLEKSMQQHQINIDEMNRKDNVKKIKDTNIQTSDKSEEDKEFASHFGEELSLLNTNLSSSQSVNTQTISKIQAQLEGKVQKLLDKLTVLTNNGYANGKHVYDYQLIRLTEGQAKAQSEALEKADSVYFKHSTLKRQEKEMNEKFDATRAQLDEYKQSFYQNKKSLEQDYKTYKQIKEKTQKELSDQIAMQREVEMSVNEALQQKADLRIKEMKEKAKFQQIDFLNNEKEEKQKQKTEAFVQKQNEDLEFQIQQEREEIQKKKQAVKEIEEAKNKKEQQDAKQKATFETEIRAKVEKEMMEKKRVEMEIEKREHEKQMKQEQASLIAKAEQEKKEHEKEVNEAKKKAQKKQLEIEAAEKQALAALKEQEKLEQQAIQEEEQLEKKEQEVKRKEAEELDKKKASAQKAKQALIAKENLLKEQESQKKAAEQKAKELAAVQLKLKQEKKAFEEQQIKAKEEAARKKKAEEERKKAEEEARAQEELKKAQEEQKKAEEDQAKVELEHAMEEQKAAEDASAKAEHDLQKVGKINQNSTSEKTQKIDGALTMIESEEGLQNGEALEIQVKTQEEKKAEEIAIRKVTKATIEGFKKGEEASLKLHADAKHQSVEKTVDQISNLKNKFDTTKSQVVAIVSNFGKIHNELIELKKEYLQEKSQMSSLVQLQGQLSTHQESEDKISQLKTELAQKKAQVHEVVDNFINMHTTLTNIKSSFEQEVKGSKIKLAQLENQNEDTQLSMLFAKQSQEIRNKLKSTPKNVSETAK